LLESAKEVGGIQQFIHVSTDEVYGEIDKEDPDLLEHSILAPTSPYAASKAAAEMMVIAYSKSFKLPAIVVRSNNVYGPHQYLESKASFTSISLIVYIGHSQVYQLTGKKRSIDNSR
jgi:dTDP-D-glucose 4,6-dehydratase